MKLGPTYVRICTSKISLTYLIAVSVSFSMTCRSVFPWALIPAHTMTDRPPKRSCSATHAVARSFWLLKTLVCLSVKSTQNLDSSVKRIGVQSLTVHVTWVCVHCKQSWIWCCVNGLQIVALRDLIPASCNLFLTVRVITCTTVTFWKSLRKVVAFENRWRLACKTFPVV